MSLLEPVSREEVAFPVGYPGGVAEGDPSICGNGDFRAVTLRALITKLANPKST